MMKYDYDSWLKLRLTNLTETQDKYKKKLQDGWFQPASLKHTRMRLVIFFMWVIFPAFRAF